MPAGRLIHRHLISTIGDPTNLVSGIDFPGFRVLEDLWGSISWALFIWTLEYIQPLIIYLISSPTFHIGIYEWISFEPLYVLGHIFLYIYKKKNINFTELLSPRVNVNHAWYWTSVSPKPQQADSGISRLVQLKRFIGARCCMGIHQMEDMTDH